MTRRSRSFVRSGSMAAHIQFARDRISGDIRVIEMNPRVSRSSALASKATGYPIAKWRRSSRSVTRWTRFRTTSPDTTPASFEPTDYVVVKIPRFAFENLERRHDARDR